MVEERVTLDFEPTIELREWTITYSQKLGVVAIDNTWLTMPLVLPVEMFADLLDALQAEQTTLQHVSAWIAAKRKE